LGRHPQHRQKQAVVAQGRDAVTHYKVLKIWGDGLVSLLACRLETGRTHQIRVHCQAHTVPLLGDPLYGKKMARIPDTLKDFLSTWPTNRPALHAIELCFRHPVGDEEMSFKAPLPKDFEALLMCCDSLSKDKT
jgi:23S rRNA pseudouridine1911/1915/1917 synthase